MDQQPPPSISTSTSTTAISNPNPNPNRSKPLLPKRFMKSAIPESLLSSPSLLSAISLLQRNYSFEIPKTLHRISTLSPPPHRLHHVFDVIVPQSRPLSAGEVLCCTSPTIPKSKGVETAVFFADGRFHLEAFMIANPGVRIFRFDPFLGVLVLEEYDYVSVDRLGGGDPEAGADYVRV